MVTVHTLNVPLGCRYDPYGRVLTEEKYDHVGMRAARRAAVELSRSASHWGLVLGTLGRQGNTRLLSHLQDALSRHGISHTVVRFAPILPKGGAEGWDGVRAVARKSGEKNCQINMWKALRGVEPRHPVSRH